MALSPSSRVKVVAEVSRRLSGEDWSLIDLTLSQFGLPTSDRWEGNSHDYLIEHLKDANDVVLVDLAHHVGFEVSSPTTGVELPFWQEGKLRLFISHLAAHREYAGALQDAFAGYGISAFVAHNDIQPTVEWQNTIESALATSEVLVALLHPDFNVSAWTDQEVGFAMGAGIPIFSVRFGQDPYGFIGRFQAFNGNGKNGEELAIELFLSLIHI